MTLEERIDELFDRSANRSKPAVAASIRAAVEEAVAAEREACAELADEFDCDGRACNRGCSNFIARDIRGRSAPQRPKDPLDEPGRYEASPEFKARLKEAAKEIGLTGDMDAMGGLPPKGPV